jgi:Phage gp6-like head-tail connector protein
MVTLPEVKNALGIKTTNRDEQINALIPLVENFIKGYCNITEIPTEYHINAIKMIEYNLNTKSGVQSESLSRHSVTFVDDYPPSVLRGLRRKLRW